MQAMPLFFLQPGYGLVLFLASAAALVLEIVAGRLLAPYVGMSLYTWTAIISVVLAGLSLGHWIGGRLAEGVGPLGGRRRVAGALGLAALASAGVQPVLRLLAGPLLGLDWNPVVAIVALAAAAFVLPSLFAGIVSPILVKLAVDAAGPERAARVIGRMFALGAAGSILGTLAAGYVFLSRIGSAGTLWAMSGLYAALALALLADQRRALAVGAALLVLAGGGLAALPQAFASPCLRESDYYCLRVEDFSRQSGRESAVLVLDHLGHGINDAAQPGLLYSSYLDFTDRMAARRFGRGRIAAFFIGGGAFTLPRAWSRALAEPHLLVAEIDPAVTALAHDRLWLERDAPGLAVVHRDARAVLQSLPASPRFDVVLGDAFHDIGIPPHLVTRQFHGEIARRLKPGGFYALNVIESRHRPRFLFALLQTLGQDFAHVEVWVDGDELSQGERITYLVLASDRASDTPILRSSSFSGRHWLRLRDDQVRARVAEAGVPDLTDDFSPVDRLMAHVLLAPEIAEK